VTVGSGGAAALWRVAYAGDPLAFAPLDLYEFSHRFDDIHRRFRTLYCAENPETALREVLADLRPNLAARQRHSSATAATQLTTSFLSP
jgi:RES domain